MKLGDPVTGVLMAHGKIVQGVVCDVPQEDVTGRFFIRWVEGSSWTTVARYLNDEGVTWVKGHAVKGSPELLALQAAWALEYR